MNYRLSRCALLLGAGGWLCGWSAGAYCQNVVHGLLIDLPEAPQAQAAPATAAGGGSIAGVVMDVRKTPVPRATVTLVQAGRAERTVQTDEAGAFVLDGLAAGAYRVTITAAGFESAVPPEIVLRSGEQYTEPAVLLPVAGANVSVQVNASEEAIAQEQVHQEEQQRFLGIFPNFYTSYLWQAAPLTRRQKFGLAARTTVDPVAFIATGAAAGVEQARNTFPSYGGGVAGYGQRYAADYGDQLSARMLSGAVFPSLFHQDPRYFYMGSGGRKTRLVYAITRAVVTRSDHGRAEPNYSRILGAFAAGALSNAYHLGPDRGVGLTLRNSSIAIGGYAGDNVLREFLFRRFTPNLPGYANGKP